MRLTNFVHSEKVNKRDFEERLPELRAELLQVQNSLRQADFPVIVLFAGVDGAGKSEMVNLLNEWMDPRWLINHAYPRAFDSDAKIERPVFRRYWNDLPPRGQIGLFLSAWYSQVLLGTVGQRVSESEFPDHIDQICRFEQMLATDGALILKFWMHLDKRRQRKRLEKLEANPVTAWRVTHTDWAHWAMYSRFVAAGDQIIDATDSAQAPWRVVDGADQRYRSLAIGQHILDAIKARLKSPDPRPTETRHVPSPINWLSHVDLSQTLTKTEYQARRDRAQGELNRQCQQAKQQKIPSVLVFEGWDAAGKGGAIRRILRALDPRTYHVIPIAAPTSEEHAYHYLWRFWRHLPRPGNITFFDRSWYGRVLVERIEGFARNDEWQRAYAEINEFEQELVDSGMMICKFWLHIDRDEQLRRFEERKTTPHKAWKLTEEDWRNREKWSVYESAVNDMIQETNSPHAPWTIVPANDKYTARVQVLETVCERLQNLLADR